MRISTNQFFSATLWRFFYFSWTACLQTIFFSICTTPPQWLMVVPLGGVGGLLPKRTAVGSPGCHKMENLLENRGLSGSMGRTYPYSFPMWVLPGGWPNFFTIAFFITEWSPQQTTQCLAKIYHKVSIRGSLPTRGTLTASSSLENDSDRHTHTMSILLNLTWIHCGDLVPTG